MTTDRTDQSRRWRLRPSARTVSRAHVYAGVAALASGAALIYPPAGALVLGVGLVLVGLLLVDL